MDRLNKRPRVLIAPGVRPLGSQVIREPGETDARYRSREELLSILIGHVRRWTPSQIGGAVFLLGAFFAWFLYLQTYPQTATVAQDELWAATMAPLSFFQALVFILRFDIHPPLYYLQLNLWSWVSQSDAWLQLNSVMWLLATGAVVMVMVRRYAGALASYLAAGFVLSTPYLVHYGFELRMYPLLAFLTLLGVWATEAVIEQPTRRHWIAVFVTFLAAAYTHALAPLVIPCHFVYGLLYARYQERDRRFVLRWIGCNALISALVLPVFINSMLRSDNHAAKPNFEVVTSTLMQLLAGTPFSDVDRTGLICLAGVIWLIAWAMHGAGSRHLILSYFVLPVMALLILSHTLRPVWLARPFLFALPIIGLAFGRAMRPSFVDRFDRTFVAVLMAIVIALQATVVIREARIPKAPDYAALAAAVRPLTGPGDAIVVLERPEIFWGVARYYAGSRWGDGLHVGVPPSENWARILTKLPVPIQTYLTRVDRFEHNGVQIIGGHPTDLGNFKRVFFVGYTTDTIPSGWRDAPVIASNGDVTAYGPLPEGAR